MAYEDILTLVNAGTLLFTIITLLLLAKNREFERSEVENSINALLFGFFIMLLIMLVRVSISLDGWMHETLASYMPQISTYVGYLAQIETLALAPLLAVCFLVAMFLARDIAAKEKLKI